MPDKKKKARNRPGAKPSPAVLRLLSPGVALTAPPPGGYHVDSGKVEYAPPRPATLAEHRAAQMKAHEAANAAFAADERAFQERLTFLRSLEPPRGLTLGASDTPRHPGNPAPGSVRTLTFDQINAAPPPPVVEGEPRFLDTMNVTPEGTIMPSSEQLAALMRLHKKAR